MNIPHPEEAAENILINGYILDAVKVTVDPGSTYKFIFAGNAVYE